MTIVHDDDLPVGMKKRQKLAHQIAEQTVEQVINIAIRENQKINLPLTGNEALSYLGTILQDFCGRWIVFMDKIRLEDDAGITQEDMVKELLNGILASIGCDASFEEEHPLAGGIKRLEKKENKYVE